MANNNKYINSQSKAAKPITTNEMVCKNCMYNSSELPPAHCIAYRPGVRYKPGSVLLGGFCPKFRRV